jgi:hypothetical protein
VWVVRSAVVPVLGVIVRLAGRIGAYADEKHSGGHIAVYWFVFELSVGLRSGVGRLYCWPAAVPRETEVETGLRKETDIY